MRDPVDDDELPDLEFIEGSVLGYVPGRKPDLLAGEKGRGGCQTAVSQRLVLFGRVFFQTLLHRRW